MFSESMLACSGANFFLFNKNWLLSDLNMLNKI